MDSMRSLNTSLPATTSPRKRGRQPPLQLLQAFKTAALQVTNLYKAAASDRETSHNEGYQDALEDILNFLDQENLGVGDGEGWRVRQWVTERLQESPLGASTSDEEEEEMEEEKRARSSSPVMQRRSSPVASPAVQNLRAGEDQARPESAPPEAATDPVQIEALPSVDFTFRAAQSMPDTVPAHHDLDMDESEVQENNNATNNNTGNSPPVQINLFPRHLRSATRNGNSNHSRRNHRSSSGSLTSSLGKRRIPFDHFFDIGPGNGKDEMGGGGKRSRFT